MRSLIIAALLLAVSLYILYGGPSSTTAPAAATGGAKWTVYGSLGCGWTTKQLEFMKKNGIAHTFVDCDSTECKHEAYPTLVSPSGEEHVGYREDF